MLFFMITGEAAPQSSQRQINIDENIFSRIGNGDNDAFEELYLATERTIYAYTLSIMKNPEDTRDIVQETYLKIRSSAHLYKKMGKPLAWMFTISKNLCKNALRNQNKTAYSEDLNIEDDIRFSYITDKSDRYVLQSALKILSLEEQQILLLHAVSGMKHHEIAKNLEIPLSTALSKYHRAIKKLKNHLSQSEQEGI